MGRDGSLPASRRVLLAYAALASVTAFFPVFSGKLPVPAECALLLLPERPAVHVANREIWDVPTQYLPWSRAVSDAYRHGRLPLRFAANGCGTPLWANPQAQVLTPTTFFSLVLPEAWAFAAAAALRLFLGAAGAFFFYRRRGLTVLSSAAAGLAFGFSLTFTTWMHYPLTYPQALLPWVLLALERVAGGAGGGFGALLTALVALFLGGYPEGEVFVCLFAAAFFVALVVRQRVPGRERLVRTGRTTAAALLALGLTSIIWLPQIHAIRASERSARVARASGAPPPPFRISDFARPPAYAEVLRFWIVPEAQGNPRDDDKFGPYSFAGRTSGYAGILVLTFGLAAFFWRRAPSAVAWARGGAVLLTLYVLWYPPLRQAFDALPGVREIANRLTTTRACFLLVFLLALLAAFALDRLRSGSGRAPTLCAIAVGLCATATVFLEYLESSGRPALTAWRASSFLLPAFLLGGAALALLRPMTEASGRALAVLFLLGTGADILRIGVRFNPGTARKDYFPVTPAVRSLQAAASGGRFATSSGSLSGMAYMYGLEDVAVQDPMTPAAYEDALRAGAGYTGPEEPFARVTRLDAPLLDFLDTRARLSSGAEVARRDTAAAILPARLSGARDEAEVLAQLAASRDQRNTAFVVGTDEAFPGEARVLSVEKPRPEEIRVRVRVAAPRLLVLPETDDGGWTAETHGETLPTLRVNTAFLGVRVPAGEAEIVCRYVPPGFRTGRTISLACFGALLVLASRAGARWSSRST